MGMVDVLEYLEYRDFLKDWFAESKKDNPFTSYRYLSQKTLILLLRTMTLPRWLNILKRTSKTTSHSKSTIIWQKRRKIR